MTKVFISYSHRDEKWKNRLVEHLGVLEEEGALDLWEDRQIEGGDDWLQEITGALDSADVAVLMITASFLNSDFVLGKEVPRLLMRREKEGVRVIPLIVKPCIWKKVEWLQVIQARPKDGRPLSTMSKPSADQALVDLAEEIDKLCVAGTKKQALLQDGTAEEAESAGEGLRRRRVSVQIDNLDVDDFDETYERLLIFGIAGFLRISPADVRIVAVETGSVRVTIEIPQESVQMLVRASEEGAPALADAVKPLVIVRVEPHDTGIQETRTEESHAGAGRKKDRTKGAGERKQSVGRGKRLLIVDDDQYWIDPVARALHKLGIAVVTAGTLAEAKEIINTDPPDMAVTDVRFLPGPGEDVVGTEGGIKSGVVLGRWMRRNHSQVPVVGISAWADPDGWFAKYAEGFMLKSEVSLSRIVEHILETVGVSRARPAPRILIVHGHDDHTRLELTHYLRRRLKFPDPVILRESPTRGRTIIEKLEDEATNVDIVFVLLTPDDRVASTADSDEEKRRARQNVIFEMGYFLGKLGRKGGRILLLHKGSIELPSDISGVIYIDISHGIEAAGESIRGEIEEWL